MLIFLPHDGCLQIDGSNHGERVVGRTHRSYAQKFNLQVIREALEPSMSVSVVARRHDINANIIRMAQAISKQQAGCAGAGSRTTRIERGAIER
ncbi:MAG: transposase [Burkholderia sp.]